MFKFLKLQYKMGKVTKEQLAAMVPKYITAEQYKQITGEDLPEADG